MPPVLSTLFGLSRTTKRVIQVVEDVVLIIASFLAAMWLRLDSLAFLGAPAVWLALSIVVPTSIALFMKLGFYRAFIGHLGLKTTQMILIGVVASSGVLGATVLLFGLSIPRSVPFLYAVLALLTVGGVRFGLRCIYLREQQQYKKRVLIYGAGEAGRQLVMSLRHGRHYEPVAFVDFAPRLQGSHVQGLKVYPPEECTSIVKAYGVQMLLLAIPGASRATRQEVIESIETMTIPVQTIPDMADVVSGKDKVTEWRDVAIEDLLGRDPIPPDPSLMGADITGKVVMVTGAGGSIGSELCSQILRQSPRQLLLIDLSEYALNRIEQDTAHLKVGDGLQAPCLSILASVQDGERLETLMRVFSGTPVYHPAVSPKVGNVLLTTIVKPVRSIYVMGASKRLAEITYQSLTRPIHCVMLSLISAFWFA